MRDETEPEYRLRFELNEEYVHELIGTTGAAKSLRRNGRTNPAVRGLRAEF
jgi:hypothetical protein